MKKHCYRWPVLIAGALILAGSLVAEAADTIQITARKKTGAKEGGKQQFGPGGGSARHVKKEVYYTLDLRSLSPKNPERAEVEWALLVEEAGGRTRIGARGRSEVGLKFGQTVSLDTNPVDLNEFQVTGRLSGTSKAKQSLKGYAVRVLDEKGSVLAEKYTSTSVQNDFERLFSSEEEGREKVKSFLKDAFKKDKRPGPFQRRKSGRP